MAVDGYVQVPPDSTGAKIDAASVGVAGNVVMRQRIVIGDNSASAQFAIVTGGALLVQPNAVAISGGVVLAAGVANIGLLNSISRTVEVVVSGTLPNINISRTADVSFASQPPVAISGTATIVIANFLAGSGQSVNLVDTANTALRVNVIAGSGSGANPVSIAAGTSNIGFINNISATVVVAGVVQINSAAAPLVLAAGTNNIGSINNISATVAAVLAAGTANIGTINNVSATVNVAITGWLDSSGNSKAIVDSVNVALRVNIVAGATSGVSQVDDTSFSTGAAAFVPVGAVFSDSGTGLSLSASHGGVLRMTGFRALHTNLRNSAGVEMGTPTSPLSVKVEGHSGTVVLAAGAAQIGLVSGSNVNISNTPSVVLAAGAANIGVVNNISATVIVLGIVQINSAAAPVIVNNISATVNVVCATPFTINNISRTVEVTVSTPFTINNISATVTVTTSNPYVINTPSGSHGPIMVQRSTSATGTVINAPGVGLHIYVTQVGVSNAGTNLTGCQIGTSASLGQITMVAAANGGGFVMQFDPPYKCFSNEALLCRCDPNPGGNCFFNVNFYVAA